MELTLPWCDEGFRILPVDLHLQYMESIRVLRARFDQAVSEFLAAYDEAKDAARESLGTLYREEDYPSSSRLRKSFDLQIRPQPLPAGHDWRIDLPADAVARIRQELEDRLEDAQRLGQADLYRRLAAVVSRMATTLSEPDKIFRDSLVGNIRDLCNLLPLLNIAADPGLDSLNRDIERRLASLDPGLLRIDRPSARPPRSTPPRSSTPAAIASPLTPAPKEPPSPPPPSPGDGGPSVDRRQGDPSHAQAQPPPTRPRPRVLPRRPQARLRLQAPAPTRYRPPVPRPPIQALRPIHPAPPRRSARSVICRPRFRRRRLSSRTASPSTPS
jgi:hypothetical protein